MAYTAPDWGTLRSAVQRDVRDEAGVVFSDRVLDDFSSAGIGELNEVRPLETVAEVQGDDAFATLGLNYVYRVDSAVDAGNGLALAWGIVPSEVDAPYSNGWTYHAGVLRFAPGLQRALDRQVAQYDAANVYVRVWGYSNRDIPSGDSDVLQFENRMDEQFVRKYSTLEAHRALLADRSLFQQWLTQANNSDVSPSQLEGMRSIAEDEMRAMRRRMYLIRHPVVG